MASITQKHLPHVNPTIIDQPKPTDFLHRPNIRDIFRKSYIRSAMIHFCQKKVLLIRDVDNSNLDSVPYYLILIVNLYNSELCLLSMHLIKLQLVEMGVLN